MADAGNDGLLAVWANRLHWSRLKHLPLQDSHGGGGGTWRSQNCGCVPWSKVTGPWTSIFAHCMRKVPKGRIVTTMRMRHRHWHMHWLRDGAFAWDVWRDEARLLCGFIRWRSIFWRQRVSLRRSSHYWSSACRMQRLSVLLLEERSIGAPGVWRRRVTGHDESLKGGQRSDVSLTRRITAFLLYPRRLSKYQV